MKISTREWIPGKKNLKRSLISTEGRNFNIDFIKCNSDYGNWENNLNTLRKLSSDYDYAIFEFDFHRGENFAEILRLAVDIYKGMPHSFGRLYFGIKSQNRYCI